MYFTVTVKEPDACGEQQTFNMDGKCNRIEYDNENFCFFVHKDDQFETKRLLMAVPYSEILWIENKEV